MFDGKHVLIPAKQGVVMIDAALTVKESHLSWIHAFLLPWAKQGVVIIDAALTVKESQFNLRHCNIGDDKFRG